MSARVLAVTPVSHPGGAELGLMRLLRWLRPRGWEITLTTPGPGPLADQARDAGLGWRALPVGGLDAGTGLRAVGSWPLVRRLSAQYDVVYLNHGVCGRLLPALPAHRTARTPQQARAPRQARAAKPARAARILHVHDMVTRVPGFWRRADLVLTDSQAAAERLTGLDAHVVYCPVDPDPPPARAPWPKEDRPVVGFVGRIEPRKGPLDLVAAAPLIRRRVPNARVVVVGDDPYGGAPEYARRVTSSTEIEHYRWVENAAGLMRHLDVLVLPSHQEPFGTVLAEAMAVGTPVVASAVDGLPEVVHDGVTGRLVAPGDPGSIAAAVVEVLSRQSEMGAAAREHAQRFATERYGTHVEGLIRGLLRR
jgi:glycosyltransferase involved in cell wall biosynthesis